jgi:hypothetical protein
VTTGLSAAGVFRALWRPALAVIVLLLAAASPITSAAQDAGPETYRYYLAATPSRSLDDLCVGDRVTIDVAAVRFLGNKRAADTDHVTNPPVQVFGVRLEAITGDPAIGTLFPAAQRTSARGSPPGSARFSFAPKKPGFTTLVFTGTESRSWFGGGDISYLSTELTATVKECDYDVIVTAHWIAGPISTYWANSDLIRLRYAGQPGHYTGSGVVSWLLVEDEPGCTLHAVPAESEVDVIAELEGEDQLIVDVDFGDPVTGASYTYMCPEDVISSTYLFKYTPAALTFTISAAGGYKHLPQTLVDNNFSIFNLEGAADVSVAPAAPE